MGFARLDQKNIREQGYSALVATCYPLKILMHDHMVRIILIWIEEMLWN